MRDCVSASLIGTEHEFFNAFFHTNDTPWLVDRQTGWATAMLER